MTASIREQRKESDMAMNRYVNKRVMN